MRNSSINWIFLWRFPIQNHPKLSNWEKKKDQYAKPLSKVLDISSATARVAPDLLKALAILSDATVRRSAVDREDLRSYWKLLTLERGLRSFPSILKYGDHRWDLPTICKTRLLQAHIEDFSYMSESSASQFFRTTTRIQLGPNAIDEERFVMTFLTTLGVTEILCSFRLVLERKTGKEIPQSSRLEFLENLLTKLFCFIRYRRQHFRAVE